MVWSVNNCSNRTQIKINKLRDYLPHDFQWCSWIITKLGISSYVFNLLVRLKESLDLDLGSARFDTITKYRHCQRKNCSPNLFILLDHVVYNYTRHHDIWKGFLILETSKTSDNNKNACNTQNAQHEKRRRQRRVRHVGCYWSDQIRARDDHLDLARGGCLLLHKVAQEWTVTAIPNASRYLGWKGKTSREL
jgi:hypothetical protein